MSQESLSQDEVANDPLDMYRERVRETHSLNPYRLGVSVGMDGQNLPSPYTPGSRGDTLYMDGLRFGWQRRRRRTI